MSLLGCHNQADFTYHVLPSPILDEGSYIGDGMHDRLLVFTMGHEDRVLSIMDEHGTIIYRISLLSWHENFPLGAHHQGAGINDEGKQYTWVIQ